MHKHYLRPGKSALILATSAIASSAGAIQFGQLDTFQDTTTQGWHDGAGNGNNIATGGPAGADDAFFSYDSFNKMVFFNDSTWAGDYLGAHVSRIEFDVASFNTTDSLQVRVTALNDPFGLRNAFSTTQAFDIPPDQAWHHVSFDLSASAMTLVNGTLTYGQVMSSVMQLRILSAAQPSYQGDFLPGTLAVDNVRAFTLPGDADFDNTVGTNDFVTLANHFNQTGASWADADFNFDGRVNALDFNALATNFGQTVTVDSPMGAVVPEPTGAVLLFAMCCAPRRYRARERA